MKTEITYIFPNDQKFCIYDIKFAVGETIINMHLQSKEEANETYQKAFDSGYTAIYERHFDKDISISEFKLGNLK